MQRRQWSGWRQHREREIRNGEEIDGKVVVQRAVCSALTISLVLFVYLCPSLPPCSLSGLSRWPRSASLHPALPHGPECTCALPPCSLSPRQVRVAGQEARSAPGLRCLQGGCRRRQVSAQPHTCNTDGAQEQGLVWRRAAGGYALALPLGAWSCLRLCLCTCLGVEGGTASEVCNT